MVDVLFIMSTRSSKYWMSSELCPYLRQLGHIDPTPKKIKHIMMEMVTLGYLETIRVKPQWSKYAYKSTGKVGYHNVPFHGGVPIDRREGVELW